MTGSRRIITVKLYAMWPRMIGKGRLEFLEIGRKTAKISGGRMQSLDGRFRPKLKSI